MLKAKLRECNYTLSAILGNNKWIECSTNDSRGKQMETKILFLIIPFEETGALETFLLDAVSEQDSYDKIMIERIKSFVTTIDPEKKYLNKRRYVTKANFDVYFSVRTPLTQFAERRDILKNIPWEKYDIIQCSFAKLKEL